MSLHFLFVPALRPEPAQTELNTLLARGRVLTLAREFVAHGADSGWAPIARAAWSRPHHVA